MTLAFKRDLLLIVGGRLLTALLGLMAIRVVTTFLSPDQYGELALFTSVQMFCGLFLINPVGQHINLHTHQWWDEGTLFLRLKSYKKYIFGVSILSGLAVFIMFGRHSFGSSALTSLSMIFVIFAGTWNATLIPMMNMLGFRQASVLLSILTMIAGLFGSILFVMWISNASAWLMGQAIGMGLGGLIAKVVLQKHIVRPAKDSEDKFPLLTKETVQNYCLPLALAMGLMWFQLSGYRFLVGKYWGFAQLGFLVLGLQLANQIFTLIESLATQFFYPLFYRRVSSHENLKEVESAFSDLLNTLVPVYLIIAGTLILSASYLLKLLVAPVFQNTVTFLMLGACIELCRVLCNLLSNAAQVKRKTQSLAFPYAAGSVISLCLIYCVAIWHLEVTWAAIVLLFASLITLIAMLIGMNKQVKISLDVPRIIGAIVMMVILSSLFLLVPELSTTIALVSALILIFFLICVTFLIIFKGNPSLLRLLDVKLRKN